ncbi:hypothetical protein GmHk_20G057706 [Glycine max]|nr:hypothetical protein GmHk_20G057706 [Glycine max]
MAEGSKDQVLLSSNSYCFGGPDNECEVCKRAIENEVNLLNSESTASNKGSYEQGPSSFSPKAYEMEGSCSSKINNTKNENNLMTNCSNKDKFLDSYTTSWQP